HAAARRNRCCARDLHLRRCFGNTFAEYVFRGFLYAQRAARNATVAQPLRHALIGAFVFLPGAHVGLLPERAALNLLTAAVLFKRGAHEEWRALLRKNHREQSLAASPLNSGEVDQRGAPGDEDRVEAVGHHQLTRALDALP